MFDPSKISILFLPWLTSRRSKLPVRYIDQLDYGPLTMTQRAVMRGDRVLFTILVGKLGANLTLPFHLMHIQGQINCYAAAALSKHQDLWFV